LITTEAGQVRVSAVPFGLLSCVLAVSLAVADVSLTASVLRMSVQEKINFAIFHSDRVGMLEGAEMVGLPVALLLGLLSRRTAVGKIGLVACGLLVAGGLDRDLFGLPVPLGQILGTPHR
jgi:hypothetical protein